MQKKFDNFLKTLLVLSDILMLSSAWIFSYFLRFHSFMPIYKGTPSFRMYIEWLPYIFCIWIISFIVSNNYVLYKDPKISQKNIFSFLYICFSSMMFLITLTYFLSDYKYSRFMFLIFACVHPIFLVFGRSIIKVLFMEEIPP